MTDILTITLNPAVDVASITPRLMPAHKMRCSQTHRFPGGGGINVTRVLHRLGANSMALYLAGGAMGQQLRKLIALEKISSHSLPIRDETRESFAVVDASTGNEYRFVLPGPTVQPHEWESCLAYVRTLKPAPRYVVLSGTLPPGVPHDAYARLSEVAKTFILKAARAVNSRKPLDASAIFDEIASAWERGQDALASEMAAPGA